MEVENSWKGRVWVLFFGWIPVGIYLVIELFEKEDPDLLILVVTIVGWLLWLLGLKHLIKLLKTIFKSK